MRHSSSEDLCVFGNSIPYPSQTCLDTVIEGDEFESSADSTEDNGIGVGMNNEADPERTINIVQVEREPNGLVRRYSAFVIVDALFICKMFIHTNVLSLESTIY
jgi:hypothetical protein